MCKSKLCFCPCLLYWYARHKLKYRAQCVVVSVIGTHTHYTDCKDFFVRFARGVKRSGRAIQDCMDDMHPNKLARLQGCLRSGMRLSDVGIGAAEHKTTATGAASTNCELTPPSTTMRLLLPGISNSPMLRGVRRPGENKLVQAMLRLPETLRDCSVQLFEETGRTPALFAAIVRAYRQRGGDWQAYLAEFKARAATTTTTTICDTPLLRSPSPPQLMGDSDVESAQQLPSLAPSSRLVSRSHTATVTSNRGHAASDEAWRVLTRKRSRDAISGATAAAAAVAATATAASSGSGSGSDSDTYTASSAAQEELLDEHSAAWKRARRPTTSMPLAPRLDLLAHAALMTTASSRSPTTTTTSCTDTDSCEADQPAAMMTPAREQQLQRLWGGVAMPRRTVRATTPPVVHTAATTTSPASSHVSGATATNVPTRTRGTILDQQLLFDTDVDGEGLDGEVSLEEGDHGSSELRLLGVQSRMTALASAVAHAHHGDSNLPVLAVRAHTN